MDLKCSADILCKIVEMQNALEELRELARPKVYLREIQLKNRTAYSVVDPSWKAELKKIQKLLVHRTSKLVPWEIQGGHPGRSHNKIFLEMLEASLAGGEYWFKADLVNGFPSVNVSVLKERLEDAGLETAFLELVFFDFIKKRAIKCPGLIQGVSFSPTLFCLYLNEAIKRIEFKTKFSSYLDDILLRGEAETVVKADGAILTEQLAQAGLTVHTSGPKAVKMIRSNHRLDHLGLVFHEGLFPGKSCSFYIGCLLRIRKEVGVNQHLKAREWLMNALACNATDGQSEVLVQLRVIHTWAAKVDSLNQQLSGLWRREEGILYSKISTTTTLIALLNLFRSLKPMSLGNSLPAGWIKPLFHYQWRSCGFVVEEGNSLLGFFAPEQYRVRTSILQSISESEFHPDDLEDSSESGEFIFESEEREFLAKNKKLHIALELHSRLIFFAPFNFLTQQFYPLEGLSLFPYPKKAKDSFPVEITNCFFFNELRYINQLNSPCLTKICVPEVKIKLLLRGLVNLVYLKLTFPKARIVLNDFYLIQFGRFVWMDYHSASQIASLLTTNSKPNLSQTQFRKKISQIINQQRGDSHD